MKKKILITAKTKNIQEILELLDVENISVSVEIEGESNKEICKKLSKIDTIDDWDFEQTENISNNNLGDTISIGKTNPIYSSECSEDIKERIRETTNNTIQKFKESIKSVVDIPENFSSSEITKTVRNEIGVSGINELATFFEAAWNIGHRSPGLIFGNNLVIKTIKPEYDNVSKLSSIDHSMIKMFLESNYQNVEIEEIIEEVIIKLNDIWKQIKDYSSPISLIYKLYKK